MGTDKFPPQGVFAAARAPYRGRDEREPLTAGAKEDTHVTDPSRYPESKPDAARRWVRLAVIVAIVVALLVMVMLLVGGGGHGPGRHL
jgi:hypothetical protein